MLSLRGCTFSTLSLRPPITALSTTTSTSALLRTKQARFEAPASTSKQVSVGPTPNQWSGGYDLLASLGVGMTFPSQIITTINQLNAEATTTPQLHNQGSRACVCTSLPPESCTAHMLIYAHI
uniref:Uncharacterized protein n=1 Tax=Stegastes partitus TaxID=144197 RepID=A0A3B5B909_9TELE